jgi:hypothetical protein
MLVRVECAAVCVLGRVGGGGGQRDRDRVCVREWNARWYVGGGGGQEGVRERERERK